MALQGSQALHEEARAAGKRVLHDGRFAGYFPRLFAYALALNGEEAPSRELAVTAFCETLISRGFRDADFEVELFRRARQLAVRAARRGKGGDGLSPRERDVISLIFDAQLDRERTAQVTGLRPDAVVATLMDGLRKLRGRLGDAAVVGGG